MSVKSENTVLTVQAKVQAPLTFVWECWTSPEHIIHWNNASPDWHTPHAENNLSAGGRFLWRMEARDGYIGFDFSGQFIDIKPLEYIEYNLDDGRNVRISFASDEDSVTITEQFEAETENPLELQQLGWQAILDNFKKYTEAKQKPTVLNFEISIRAKAGKVYTRMLDEVSYKEWTAAFDPSSTYKGSWEKGSKMLFLGTDHNGKVAGMVSRIKENIPDRYVSIEHLGIFQDDNEITSGPEAEGWAGAMENYTFTETNGTTLLSVDLDASKEFLPYFTETWPKALDRLKEICEKEAVY